MRRMSVIWGPVIRRWSYRAVFAASIIIAVLAYGIPLWYHVHGQRILVVTSGSMAPTFNTGDAVIIEPISPSELRAGQVVTFWPIDHSGPLTTHRIVGLVEVTDFDGPNSEVPIRDSNGDIQKSQFIRTQGDANKSLDGNLTPIANVRGTVSEVKRGWGYPLGYAHSALGRLLIFAPPLILLLTAELLSWRRRPVRAGAANTRAPGRPAMPWHLPREQGRRLTIAATIASFAFLAQGPASTSATFTSSSSVSGTPISTGTWCASNVYPATVLATAPAPRNYLHLDETGVVVFVADSAVGPPPNGIVAGAGHVWGSTGLLDCSMATSLGLNGSGTPQVRTGGAAVTGPTRATLSAWVDVASGQGRLVGFSRSATGASNRYDRTLYVDSAGYLRFGIWKNFAGPAPNGINTIRSDAPITGARHHVAASVGPAGMRLFVDGVLQAQTIASITQGRTGYTGYWRIGWDSLPVTWPGITTANAVPVARVDEVALWHSELTAAQITTLAGANHD